MHVKHHKIENTDQGCKPAFISFWTGMQWTSIVGKLVWQDAPGSFAHTDNDYVESVFLWASTCSRASDKDIIDTPSSYKYGDQFTGSTTPTFSFLCYQKKFRAITWTLHTQTSAGGCILHKRSNFDITT